MKLNAGMYLQFHQQFSPVDTMLSHQTSLESCRNHGSQDDVLSGSWTCNEKFWRHYMTFNGTSSGRSGLRVQVHTLNSQRKSRCWSQTRIQISQCLLGDTEPILFLVSEFLKSSLTFLVFYISSQIHCRGKFLCFFLSYSLAHHKNPLEIFPYGAPPSPLEN